MVLLHVKPKHLCIWTALWVTITDTISYSTLVTSLDSIPLLCFFTLYISRFVTVSVTQSVFMSVNECHQDPIVLLYFSAHKGSCGAKMCF